MSMWFSRSYHGRPAVYQRQEFLPEGGAGEVGGVVLWQLKPFGQRGCALSGVQKFRKCFVVEVLINRMIYVGPH